MKYKNMLSFYNIWAGCDI